MRAPGANGSGPSARRRVSRHAFIAYVIILVILPIIASMAALVVALTGAEDRPRLIYLASLMAGIAFLGFRFIPEREPGVSKDNNHDV